jgi:hypothetical protein
MPSSAQVKESRVATLRRPRQQRYRHWWEGVDWPVFAVWISGVVLAVAFWIAVGLGIAALV